MGILKHKICLLGSFGVGKTSLMERFVNDRFDEKYLSTVGISVSQKLMPPLESERGGSPNQFMFLIWDIAGLEKFNPMVMNYFRGATGALAVADVSRPQTIGNLVPIVDKFISVNPNAAMVTVGNKSDIIDGLTDVPVELEQLADQYASETILTSAKSGVGVEKAFVTLSKRIEVLNGRPV